MAKWSVYLQLEDVPFVLFWVAEKRWLSVDHPNSKTAAGLQTPRGVMGFFRSQTVWSLWSDESHTWKLQKFIRKPSWTNSFKFKISHIVGCSFYMDVSKNRGTPKWMVYNGKPKKNGWFGGTIVIGNTHINKNKISHIVGCSFWYIPTLVVKKNIGGD